MALSPKPVGNTARTSFPLRRQPLVFPTPRETSSRANSKDIFDYGYNWSDLIIPLNLLTSCWHWSFWLTRDWPIIMPNCLPFVDERHLVKCKGSAAGFSFPPHPLSPIPLFALAPCVRATSPWLSLSPAKRKRKRRLRRLHATCKCTLAHYVFLKHYFHSYLLNMWYLSRLEKV